MDEVKSLRTIVGEAVGEASTLFQNDDGVFDSTRAMAIVDRVMRAIDRKAQLETLITGHMEAMRPLLAEARELADSGRVGSHQGAGSVVGVSNGSS